MSRTQVIVDTHRLEVPVSFLSRIALLGVFCPFIVAQSGQTAATNTTMRDGGVTETLQSIYIPPLVNAPFTATVHTEWTRPLSDGGTYTVVNQRQVARDRNGRIFEERWLLVPKDGRFKSQKNVIQIADPNEHTLYNCFPLQHPQRCYLQAFAERAQTTARPAIGQSGPLADNSGFTTHEELGGRDIEGMETRGFRDTTTLNVGVFGNDRPMVTTREFWYADKIGVNLVSIVDGPRTGKQTFTLSDINLTDPDMQLFELPAGFEIVDQRTLAQRNQGHRQP
jgi:hypothetical protein